MVISLDYDETFTRDPELWLAFIATAKSKGHTVLLITMREDTPWDADEVRSILKDKVDDILFTNCKAKKQYAAARGYRVDVWIDDQPSAVYNDFYRVGYDRH